ncbi:zinc finger protein 879 [Lucilia sericata]|uniref:zinc finger protein 879 n=1 Tax=Lucilia sericata TaxID=13632 RepID=UPI0018A81BA0|nr:zinc finger protein 879 [Lucilia sericata]
MSVLTYPPTNEEEIFRHCTKECGIITSTEDQQYFALGCLTCSEKFMYFDAFIEHMQTMHVSYDNSGGSVYGRNSNNGERSKLKRRLEHDSEEDLTTMLLPPVVMIKEEKIDEDDDGNGALIQNEPLANDDDDDYTGGYYSVKQEQTDPEISMEVGDSSYMGDSFGSYNDEYAGDDDDLEQSNNGDDTNYDDLVEESLLENTASVGVTSHIKDRKMIQFLIDAYRRNTFLWDHRHPQFRDRVRRSQFIDYINSEFKKRFNLTLAKDAVTRKWDNLRTVYKRECNRMALEKTNVSTLWYFKELHFLNRLYGGNQKISDAVVKETVYRRRYSALWNDISTNKMLQLLKCYPCFYDKYNIDYRSKEKRGEALQRMVNELVGYIDVTTIQISKRISQLRFDYSKQKQERLMCEMSGRAFSPTYSYYEAMFFMDNDIAPFKCEHCPMILNSPRELDTHLLTHQHKIQQQPHPVSGASASKLYHSGVGGSNMGGSNYYCPVCQLGFNDLEQYTRHKQIHPALKEVKYHCDLCTASFREKSNFDEHMRRHNDELLLPDLTSMNPDDGEEELITDDRIANSSPTRSDDGRGFRCHYPNCAKQFTTRNTMMDHVKSHYNEEEFSCDICGKVFRSIKNLQNHKQIHDAVKKYICKICGSAFAQAAGLYLHKRRHNRQQLERT